MAERPWLLVTESGELHLKSKRTRLRMQRLLDRRLRAALARHAPSATLRREERRLTLRPVAEEADRAAAAAARVFGVHAVHQALPFREDPLDAVLDAVAEVVRPEVAGRTFAVRIRRRGGQSWRSTEVAADLGARLVGDAAGVDLERPEVEVRLLLDGDVAWLLRRTWSGPAGLPLEGQRWVLTLLSGGFDSAVAAWTMMSRGVPTDCAHLSLGCGQADHAVAVASDLARDWAPGLRPRLWMLDGDRVGAELRAHVSDDLRQLALKQVLLGAADRLAERTGHAALVTGDALGQVSSQTLPNLVALEGEARRPVLRPLLGMAKEEILARARRIGTHDLSARARELCDLADGPVAVAVSADELTETRTVVERLVEDVLAGLRVVDLAAWRAGQPLPRVVGEVPAGAALVEADDARASSSPTSGLVACRGREAVSVATRAAADGAEAAVLWPPPEAQPTAA